MLCIGCSDIVSPFRAWQKGTWRWCQCYQAGVRWRDGDKGLLEVTHQSGPSMVRVIGMNNDYLLRAVRGLQTPEEWRLLHTQQGQHVDPYYLFHKYRRNCWSVIIRPGETADVFHIPYEEARGNGTDQRSERSETDTRAR